MDSLPMVRNIDLTNDLFYPPLPGLPPLEKSAVDRIIEQHQKERELLPPPSYANEFRVISKDEEGRTVVSDWVKV